MEEERMTVLGERFPEMEVVTTHGVEKLPQDYEGKWFVLFSHPSDFTPVCTTEFVEFAKRADDFKKMNTELIGLSVDSVFSHIKWTEWIKDNLDVEITYPIIEDALGKVATKLGMLHPAKGSNTVRAVFIVDGKGVIRLIMYYPQEIGRDVNEVLRAVKALQTADVNKVAIPEKWPNNPIIGNKVIIPPTKTDKEAKARLKEIKSGKIEGFDWWFAFKDLK